MNNCSPNIHYINLTNCGTDTNGSAIGIYSPSSNPTIYHVTISGSSTYWGIELGTYADARLYYSEITTDVSDDKIAVLSYSGIDIDNEYNNIYTESGIYALYLSSSADNISITHNHWGAIDPDPDSLLITNRWSKITSWRPYEPYIDYAGKITSQLIAEISPLKEAYELEEIGDINGVISVYKEVINNYNDPVIKRKAIKSIYRINLWNKLEFEDLRNTILNEIMTAKGSYRAVLDYIFCDIFVNEGKYMEAISAFLEKSEEYKGTVLEVEMMVRVANIYGDFLNDKIKAREFAEKAARINPGQVTILDAYASAGLNYDPSNFTDIFSDEFGISKQQPGPEEKPDFDTNTEFVTVTPNPANPVTTITYSITEPSNVKLEIYSISGQKVATLVDRYMQAGVHSAGFNGSNLASGVYVYNFHSKGFKKSGKMLMVK